MLGVGTQDNSFLAQFLVLSYEEVQNSLFPNNQERRHYLKLPQIQPF